MAPNVPSIVTHSPSFCLDLSLPCSIGIISDTHGLLRPEAISALHGSSAIIHAGDIGDEAVLRALEQIAPVYAVRGNNDVAEWARAIPHSIFLTLNDLQMLVLHDLHDVNWPVDPASVRTVISGHSHRPLIEEREGMLYINPGSAGPRRFSLPVSMAILKVEPAQLSAKIHVLL